MSSKGVCEGGPELPSHHGFDRSALEKEDGTRRTPLIAQVNADEDRPAADLRGHASDRLRDPHTSIPRHLLLRK